MLVYYALLEQDLEAGGYTVTLPDFGWGITQGEDLAEATERARALLEDMIVHMIGRNEEIPVPKRRRARGKNLRAIELTFQQSAKLQLYWALKSSGVTKSELARRMGMPKANVNRLFDLLHATRMDLLDEAFRALGKRLAVVVEDAA